jgi:hypothetical protein
VVTNIGQVRQALACGQVFWTGSPQNPLGSAWGHPSEALLGPGGLGERTGGVDGDDLAGDVDLAGGFPVPADGGVV